MHEPRSGFPQLRLDAYHAAEELAAGVYSLGADIGRGHADLKDQLIRAACAIPRNIAEAANRETPRDRRSRFAIARGECGECESALRLVRRLRLAPRDDCAALQRLADRVGAMLTGLVRKESSRI